jgi:hypothetical protein
MYLITITDKYGITSSLYAVDVKERDFYLNTLKKSNPNAIVHKGKKPNEIILKIINTDESTDLISFKK